VLQGKLYKRSITGALQWCVTPQEGQEILRDIHAGVCGHHASSRSIAAKAFRVGFYWLTAIEDAKDIVRKCEACRISTAHTSSRIATNTIILAVCTMGSRHGRETTQILARRACLYAGSSRQIHQMGRSSPSDNPRFHSCD
jgi:hypothetical protein